MKTAAKKNARPATKEAPERTLQLQIVYRFCNRTQATGKA
jgi:hypothetical protein